MFDDDGWPPLPATWSTLRSLVGRPAADDDLSTASVSPLTIDFDRGRSPHHWPYWREPWLRGFQAFPDEGTVLGISGYGPIGAATFILSLEPGAKVIFHWPTSIITMSSGAEQRISPFASPRRRFEGVAFLLDAGSRDVRGTIMRAAATGSTFLLALPYEDLVISQDSPNNVIFVDNANYTEWLYPSQRAIVLSPDGTSVSVVVQLVTSTTIQVRVTDANGNLTTAALGAAGRAGGRIMPVLPVVLEQQQGFARYPVNADLWSIRAVALTYGWTGNERMGINAPLTTFTDGATSDLFLTDDDLLIWDRPNAIEGTASEAVDTGAELIDLGAIPAAIGSKDVPDWTRTIRYRSSSLVDWAWFKAFIGHLRGQQGVFALSTNRPDLLYVSTVSGGIKVSSASVAGAGDYGSWFASPAHRRLAITVGVSTTYYEVLSVTDNGDGTLTLALDVSIPGTPSKISLLEQVRFERDDIEVMWDTGSFEIEETVRVAQDALEVRSRFVYDRIVTLSFSYSGIPPDVPPTTQMFSIPAGGRSYLVNVLSDRTLGFGGVIIAGGAVEADDGMVVTIENNNTSAFSISCNHEDTGISSQIRRFHNAGLIAAGGAGKSITYRYHGTTQRWIQILG